MKIILYWVLFMIVFSCSYVEKEPFTFVQLCDTQLGMGGYEQDIKSFEQAVLQINELNPDFAVICGDLVHDAADSTYVEFKRVKRALNVPCYLAPGNHDVGNLPTAKSLNYYRKIIGKDYFTFENKGYSFMVANTQLWKVEVESESKLHNEWFENTLRTEAKKNNPVFVIGHYPIFLKTPDEEEVYFNLPIEKRAKILNLFKNNNVKAYLSGHKHETVINNYEGMQFVSGETTSKNFDGRPLGFRLWNVAKDSISHQFVPLKKKI
ncbi:MAG: metallophosphoesterase [Reichenbachiella sp.]